jgi:predicted nucleic acid-binding protein
MVVLDSSFLIDIIQKDPAAIEKLKELESNDEMICTTVISILELYKGAYRSSQVERNLLQVEEIISSLIHLQIDCGVYETFGKLSASLLKNGNRIGDFDEVIAAICLAHNQNILTGDSHFNKIIDLSILSY